MIGSLLIRNLATIEDLELNFKGGFSILTGETGAGKSIIIDGIKLILGEKASPDLVRTGKSEATVEAIFDFSPDQPTTNEIPFLEDGRILIHRQVPHEGTGKAYLNGVLVPVRKLKEIGPALVDIYGQNDHIFLLQTENHLRYLDDYLELAPLREKGSLLVRDLRRLARQKTELETKQRERAQRIDFLGFQIREIEGAALKPGEWEELQAERNILKNAEKIARLVDQALDLASLEDHSIGASLARLQDAVRELGNYDAGFRTFDEALSQTVIAVRELADYLIKYKERQSLGPERLEGLEDRLAAIEKLKRKYGETVEDILAYISKARLEYLELQQSEERLTDLDAEISRIFLDYKTFAEKLSRLRREGARKLKSALEREMSLLGMKRVRFEVKIDTSPLEPPDLDALRESGLDVVEFMISPNPGEELRPLRRVASGGELSRIMLALKTIGKEGGGPKTFIFDEIDSGIGGKTAECIAEKLRLLADRHQVICITHLPQIASFAVHHFQIEKTIARDRTYTTVKELSFEDRVAEVSRLLSGSRITSTSLQNAREMLLHNLKRAQKGT
jgi:DNA repair protein RecN (Recombination protein N)